jgi:NhaA family Na+:H+ antiporter
MEQQNTPGRPLFGRTAFGIESMAETLIKPFQKFFRTQAMGGILLLGAALAAIIFANSPAREAYQSLWETVLTISIGKVTLSKDLLHWINDGLMAIFFFVVGLEIKRELLVGELATARHALLPISAALGGMVVPAAIYAAFNLGGTGEAGWGIPMATDIAFALGCLALLGRAIPTQLVVFLTALAIVDDLGGILVIALFYTENISFAALLAGAGFLVVSFVLNRVGVRSTLPYVLIGIFMWLALLKSGVHATVAGVLLAMTIPSTTLLRHSDFVKTMQKQLNFLTGSKEDSMVCPIELDDEGKQTIIQALESACHHLEAPLQRIQHNLEPWVIYLIVPIFAFANAGVELTLGGLGAAMTEPVFAGIALGLIIGKQLGILSFSWVAVRAGFSELPRGVGWGHIYGAGLLAGIGFTMSLFIGTLAFDEAQLLQSTKLAILGASVVSGVLGLLILKRVTGRGKKPA